LESTEISTRRSSDISNGLSIEAVAVVPVTENAFWPPGRYGSEMTTFGIRGAMKNPMREIEIAKKKTISQTVQQQLV
jgi:hypothetical protein